MAGLVNYSDSDTDIEEDAVLETSAPPKKRKLSSDDNKPSKLPPLPARFLDQYSSTVRTSTQDDPALHAGRKRVTPHVEGNWPAHVYLEWHPPRTVAQQINNFLPTFERPRSPARPGPEGENGKIHSLLQNDLGVPLPLHMSLSRPLVLKTDQKDSFLRHLTRAIADEGIRSFDISPKDLAWHPNESSTRWFLVLRLDATRTPELATLLMACNEAARIFNQPQLYIEDSGSRESAERFHISLAWSLSSPHDAPFQDQAASSKGEDGVRYAAMRGMIDHFTVAAIGFTEVKVRIGQDVNTVPLKARRKSSVAT